MIDVIGSTNDFSKNNLSELLCTVNGFEEIMADWDFGIGVYS